MKFSLEDTLLLQFYFFFISDLKNNILPVNNSETLSKKNQYNEMIMNGLRTSRGVNLNNLSTIFKSENLNEIVQKWPQLIIVNDYLKLKDDDYMLLDEITSELFI